MPRKANEISVKWLESKDAGKIHYVNVKHVIGQHGKIAVGKEIVVKLNTRLYRCTVVDLLDWMPPKKIAPRKLQDKGKDPKKNTAEKVYAMCNIIIESKLIIFIFLFYSCLLQQKDTLARKWIPFFWL